MIGLILQARMNSNRFPGKVMERINGKPLISHVVNQCRLAYNEGPVIVCTSVERSDDEISNFCQANNIDIFRGPLEDVYSRYLGCIDCFGLSAFGRICCDSPGISVNLIQDGIKIYKEKKIVDLVSNVCVRTFPVGQSVEVVNAKTFASDFFRKSLGFSCEHVTQSFYRESKKYIIFNISTFDEKKSVNWAVDEVGDIERVSELLKIGFNYSETSIVVDKWEG